MENSKTRGINEFVKSSMENYFKEVSNISSEKDISFLVKNLENGKHEVTFRFLCGYKESKFKGDYYSPADLHIDEFDEIKFIVKKETTYAELDDKVFEVLEEIRDVELKVR